MARLENLPPYLFSAIDAARDRARRQGVDVVDLGRGRSRPPDPGALVELAATAVRSPAYHRYPSGRGDAPCAGRPPASCAAATASTSIRTPRSWHLVGSKEGIAHLPLALIEEGDNVLVPTSATRSTRSRDPGRGRTAPLPAGAEPGLPARPGSSWRRSPTRTRLLLGQLPQQPHRRRGRRGLYEPLAALARERDLVLANDAAYLEVSLDEHRPVSLLEAVDHKRTGWSSSTACRRCST